MCSVCQEFCLLIFGIMSILSTDTTVLTSDLSLVHSTDSFGTTSTSTGNVFVGAPDDPFGNLVNALWSLPPEVGNVLLEDPPEGVPDDVFLDDVGDEEDEDDDDDESFDLLAESQPKKKKFRTLRSWTYDYKLRAVVDTFYILKDELAGQRKYNIPAYMNPNAEPTVRELNNYLFRVDRWRKKRGVVNRRVTHVCQKVEKDQGLLDDWVAMVNATIKAHGIEPQCIVSMDETNCYLDQSKKIGSQLAYIGSKEVRMCERIELPVFVVTHIIFPIVLHR
jgi:hypothetical protein